MNCKKCGALIESSLPMPTPYFGKWNCGCYFYDNEEEWLASSDYAEQQREREWYAKGGDYRSYAAHYGIKLLPSLTEAEWLENNSHK